MGEESERMFGLKRKEVTGRWSIINCAVRDILLSTTAVGITQPPGEWVTGSSVSEERRPGGLKLTTDSYHALRLTGNGTLRGCIQNIPD
jgi:hypothetical protein